MGVDKFCIPSGPADGGPPHMIARSHPASHPFTTARRGLQKAAPARTIAPGKARETKVGTATLKRL